jgi:hypothetical protein
MKPFDLQAAIAGAPIQTVEGTSVKFIAHVPEAEIDQRIIILAPWRSILCYREDNKELVMTPVSKTYWVNVYAIKSRLPCFGIPFDNEAEAIQDADYTVGYIKTISFIIEE